MADETGGGSGEAVSDNQAGDGNEGKLADSPEVDIEDDDGHPPEIAAWEDDGGAPKVNVWNDELSEDDMGEDNGELSEGDLEDDDGEPPEGDLKDDDGTLRQESEKDHRETRKVSALAALALMSMLQGNLEERSSSTAYQLNQVSTELTQQLSRHEPIKNPPAEQGSFRDAHDAVVKNATVETREVAELKEKVTELEQRQRDLEQRVLDLEGIDEAAKKLEKKPDEE